MKRRMTMLMVCFVGLFVLTSISHAAEVVCPKMDILFIGDQGIWAKNISGASCGSIANGTPQYFVFDTSKLDRQLALALSAMSMNKIVWVHALGDTTGSILNQISISK